jgi:DNA-binding NarL/FixJ family response regulator
MARELDEARSISPASGMVTRPARIRLALLDDHPVFRRGLVDLLRGEPSLHVAIEAGATTELMAALETTPVDLVILDLQLPDGSGLDVIPKLVGPRRVLVLSAFDDAQLVKRALESGAQGFVRKDAEPRLLLKAIADAAAGRTVLGADLALKLAESLRAEPDRVAFVERVRALTPRQREVLRELAEGRSNREVAAALFVSEGTVKNHVTQILQALGARDRTRLAVLVARYGLG